MVPLGSIYSAGDSPIGKIPSIPWRDVNVRSYILPPTQAGTLVFTPSVWEPRFRRLGRVVGSWLVGWLVGCTCWGWYICYNGGCLENFWKRKTAVWFFIWKKIRWFFELSFVAGVVVQCISDSSDQFPFWSMLLACCILPWGPSRWHLPPGFMVYHKALQNHQALEVPIVFDLSGPVDSDVDQVLWAAIA